MVASCEGFFLYNNMDNKSRCSITILFKDWEWKNDPFKISFLSFLTKLRGDYDRDFGDIDMENDRHQLTRKPYSVTVDLKHIADQIQYTEKELLYSLNELERTEDICFLHYKGLVHITSFSDYHIMLKPYAKRIYPCTDFEVPTDGNPSF